MRKLVVLLAVLAGTAGAQVSLTSTTLATAITSPAVQQITVASTSGISVGNLLFVDREAMQVLSIAGSVLTVARGQSPVIATAHVSGATVLAGPPSHFYNFSPKLGTPCTPTATDVTPWVNLQDGSQYTCTGSPSVWAPSGGASASCGTPNCSVNGNLAVGGTASVGTMLPGAAPPGTVGAFVGYSPNEMLNVKAFGAKGDARSVTDAAITASSTMLTSATAAFNATDSGKLVLVGMGPQAVVTGTYTSGITATGSTGQSCNLTFSTPSGGAAATAVIYLTGSNAIAGGSILYFRPDTMGSGYISAPSAATAISGTATCSGTVVVSTIIHALPVLTTATYINATTVTLANSATTTVSAAMMTISTDDTAAIQAAINAAQIATTQGVQPQTSAAVYLPPGMYGIQGVSVTGSIKITGDGSVGLDAIELPNYPPYLAGSVLNMMKPTTDAVTVNGARLNTHFYDFGVRFDPALAFWQTGNGFLTTQGTQMALFGGEWRNLKVWGTDGNHYAYNIVMSVLWNSQNLMGFGGGGLRFYGNGSGSGNSVVSGAYFAAVAGGTADCYNVSSDTQADMSNLLTYVRPQCNLVGFELTWPTLPAYNAGVQQIFDANAWQQNITVIAADFEYNTYPYKVTFPSNDTYLGLMNGPTNSGIQAGSLNIASHIAIEGSPSDGSFCAGAYYLGTTAYALDTQASCFTIFGANIIFYQNTGLTVGSPFTLTEVARIANGGILINTTSTGGGNKLNVNGSSNFQGATSIYFASANFLTSSPSAVSGLPGCNTGNLLSQRGVTDATLATPGSAVTGGGNFTVAVRCIYNSGTTTYSWVID